MCDCLSFHTPFSEARDQVAQKIYKCEECGAIIGIGQKYRYCAGKTDGELWTFRMCLECSADWKFLSDTTFDAGGDGCICYGKLEEEINDAVDVGWLDPKNPDHRDLIEKWLPELCPPDEEVELSAFNEEECFVDGKQAHFSFFQ